MSVASILDPATGVILSQYLPASHASVQSITAGNGIALTGTTINPIVSTALSAGAGITLSGTSVRQIANNGVLSVSAGTGITVGGTATAPTIANSGVLSVGAGTGITITGTATAPIVNALSPTIAQQITGTLATLVIPPTGGPNPAKTLATLDVSALGSFNSFTVYLKLSTGAMATPDATAYNYQYFLSAGLNGNLDETKGCQVGLTADLLNTQSDFLPLNTLLYRSATPISILYLNVQVLIGQIHSGSTWTNPSWTADVYCSNI